MFQALSLELDAKFYAMKYSVLHLLDNFKVYFRNKTKVVFESSISKRVSSQQIPHF